MADREKLIELLAQVQDSGTIVIPTGQGERYEWVSNQKVADHLIANGVTFATDNNVGGKLSPTANSSSEVAKILDVYIPCQTCGKLIPAGGNNHCLTCRLWLLRLEETMPKWIPVTERLPDESIPSQHYLCWYKGRVRILKYWRTRKRFESNGRVANVTHWMPLPEAPKEG